MSSFDKYRVTFPSGAVFEASIGIEVNIRQVPKWLFDGFSEVFAASDRIKNSGGDLTEQVFEGAGSKARIFNMSFTKKAGSESDKWGDFPDGDITQKMQALDHELATVPVTSTNVAKLEFGEYSDPGAYEPVAVVPGETDLSVNFGEQTGAFVSSVPWIDAVDLSQILHQLG